MFKATAFKATLFLTGFIFFFNSFATPPINNDDCANATSLTLGLTNTTGTVKSMTPSTGLPSIPAGCATGTADDDVWFKFTLTTAQSVDIALSNIGSNLS